MNSAMNVVPETKSFATGPQNTEALATAIANVLSDTYRLMFKTHAYHWNVEGPLFYSLHKLTEEQYEDLFAAADELAERIRALGHMAPMKLADITSQSVVKDLEDIPSAGEMCEDLANDHERIAHRMHALIELSGKHRDAVTEDMATARSSVHEQAVWMLRAIAAK
ncbi:Dps family protein [Sedimentitalea arenosa]|jgi:starvation-inducible DNA-binding protein|uniref:DNA starvation/stationary phase protection protein n=1 Tax=Sedimentitalea arenosa TaxID=2798803 RepID=A0A8J7LSN7_9RHOB|nr:DNA starvation/stationary phase protection protein [Arenibacterium arenosum]MBJ6373063.1 DNA starvation/stationary phase protection protein [Arenibacterium arenosum]